MVRGRSSHEVAPLEVIDLEPELGAPADGSRARWAFRSAVAAVAAAATVLAVVVASRHDSPPATVQNGPIVGRFYPRVRADTTRIVLPSGVRIVLSGDLDRTIGGLGVLFGGDGFRIAYGAPGELFASLKAATISAPLPVGGSDARAADLAQYGGRLAVLSTGDWTLVAFLADDARDAAFQLTALHRWHLESTASGALLRAPAETISHPFALFGLPPDLTDRQIELTDSGCVTAADRTVTDAGGDAVSTWCANGVLVRIEGPRSYVEHAASHLRVGVERGANG